jgi:hypothetical protein
MTSNRLLGTEFFNQRVDGWLSLSGGRIGPAEHSDTFLPPNRFTVGPDGKPAERPRIPPSPTPDVDISFIYATGEHEIKALPETSPWAQKYGAGPRERRADIVDTEPGGIYDTTTQGNSTKGWGFEPKPGTAQVYVYPNARDGKVIADVVRLDKGHTEGLEPNVTDELLKLLVSAPGGKVQSAG